MKYLHLYIGTLCAVNSLTSCTQQMNRPNVIFVLTDDQRFDALGCMGNNDIKTPNIDALASEGVLFTNAYATTPISCVSRASILTGQYASHHGIKGFGIPLTSQQFSQCYPTLMRNNGYYIGFIGKFGVGGYDSYPSNEYDYWKSFPRQGWYFKKDSLKRKGILNNHDYDNEEHLTVVQGKEIIDFLQTRDKSKPFCLSVSFKAPHCQDEMRIPGGEEFPIDKRDSLLYQHKTFEKPLTAADSFYYALPESFRFSKIKNKQNEARARWQWRFATDSLYQATVTKYYSLISGVDREIGNMMAELKAQGVDDNTIIIFMGDNGYYLGEHGLAGKWFAHDQSIRIPLLIYDPRLPQQNRGVKSSTTALNIDICPTILSAGGVKIPSNVDGQSLLPIVKGEKKDLRDEFYIEYEYNPKGAHLPAMEGFVTDDYKYVRYFADNQEWFEFYDRKKDTLEVDNLINRHEYSHQITLMKEKMLQYQYNLKERSK